MFPKGSNWVFLTSLTFRAVLNSSMSISLSSPAMLSNCLVTHSSQRASSSRLMVTGSAAAGGTETDGTLHLILLVSSGLSWFSLATQWLIWPAQVDCLRVFIGIPPQLKLRSKARESESEKKRTGKKKTKGTILKREMRGAMWSTPARAHSKPAEQSTGTPGGQVRYGHKADWWTHFISFFHWLSGNVKVFTKALGWTEWGHFDWCSSHFSFS